MAFKSKYTGAQCESLLDKVDALHSVDLSEYVTTGQLSEGLSGKQDIIEDLESIRNGALLGMSALQNIPSEYITETELINKSYATTSMLNNKVDKINGKQLSTEDFTTALKNKLEGLNNYDDTELSNALSTLRGDFDKVVSGDTTTAIKTFNEVIAFLDGIADTEDLESIIASIEQQIAGKMDKVTLAAIATSGDYNDLTNKPTIQKALIIGDSDDEAKANFAALVNGTVSADYYIGSIAFEGNILQGVVSPYIASAVSGGN